jgi:large subunit ribosomal protein L7/L12
MYSSSHNIVRRAAVSAGLRPRPTHSATRAFSSAPNAPETTPTPPPVTPENDKPAPVFKYAKSQDLFERITETMLVKEDIHALQEEISKILGRSWRKNEFYYTGFGGRKVKGGKGGAGADEAAAEAVPVKTLFDLKLVGFDATSKIKVIKEVRAIAGLGLKEAKEMVEGFPKVILKDLKQEQADEFKVKLEELGAIIELV